MNKTLQHAATSLVLACALVLVLASSVAAKGERATAELHDAQGNVVGTATFVQEGAIVRLTVELKGLPAGFHGIHIHAVGKCEPPDFKPAGSHFNPLGKKHGLENAEGPHAGDLPNMRVEADGTGRFETTTDRVSLLPGPLSLFDDDGSSLVLHASLDDQKTDPSGNSGDRIACGIIQQAATSTPAPPAPPVAPQQPPPPQTEKGSENAPISWALAALFALLLILIVTRALG